MPRAAEPAGAAPGLDRVARRLVWGLAGLGGLLRLAVAFATVDIPGDGPSRAALGWQWRHEPRLVAEGSWLPLGEVLVGLTALLVPDPRWAARALSLLTGTLTIPLLASLLARLAGPAPAVAAAALLALLPIHITLSAASLIDVPALFFSLLAMRIAMALPAEGRPWPLLAALALAGGIATGLRYEAWLLLLLLPLHRLLVTRAPSAALLVALLLAPVPLYWLLTGLGGPAGLVRAFAQVGASGATVGGRTVGLAEAAAIAVATLAQLAGPATLALAAAGSVLLLAERGRAGTADRLIWLVATVAALLVTLVIARERGPSFVDRYALGAAVLALSLAPLALAPALLERLRGILLVIALAGSTALATALAPPELYLARRFPNEIVELARFLDRERRAGEAILFTRAGWLPTYVPLLHPLGREDYRIVSWYLSEPALRAFLARRRPSLLVSREGDEAFLERIRAAGAEPGERLARFGRLEVRRLHLPAAPRDG
ncbi:MAG: glycosyltransferase family 39 protein [Geminicoccaceae bacterium]|nr:glycosyltransferase family 39 protein [Geminicoccaceae bacterium]